MAFCSSFTDTVGKTVHKKSQLSWATLLGNAEYDGFRLMQNIRIERAAANTVPRTSSSG